MFVKIRFWMAASIALLLLLYILPFQGIFNYIKFEFYPKNNLHINLSLVNLGIGKLSFDPSNHLVLRVEVFNSEGLPVPNARVKLSVSDNYGVISPSVIRTDRNGEVLASYSPPPLNNTSIINSNIILKAIINTRITSSKQVSLVQMPVVFIPGYQENSDAFDNMKDYLTSKGFDCNTFEYDSTKGVAISSKLLSSYLENLRNNYLSKGIQVKKFILVSHSMGGLVARYYTCDKSYISNHDVSKIIFISVPHSGSPWATLGLKYFNDQGIRDLSPESSLFINVFPSMLNRGLNSSIEVGNILGQYDEVVSEDSASLDEWNIGTELFSVGENKLSMNSLIDGNQIGATNHQIILSNRKVFSRIYEMLTTKLPFPTLRG